MTEHQHLATIYKTLARYEGLMKTALLQPENMSKTHWRECEQSFLVGRLNEKIIKLSTGYQNKDIPAKDLTKLCVDIGNFAMMINDNIERGNT